MLTEAARPAPAAMDEVVARAGARIRPDDEGLRDWYERYRREHAARLAIDLEILGRHASPESRVLEYGAVPLLLTAALAELGYEVRAVDVAPARFAGAIRELGLDVRECDVEAEPLPFGEERFDVVLFNELFEHLRIDPIFTLGEARRVLRPNGVLLLSTPNLRSFRGLRNLLLREAGHASSGDVYRQYEKLTTLGHMGHVREYTRREVTEFLGHVGFDVTKVIYRGGHGAGIVGLAERLMPSMRPSFTLVAIRSGR